MGKKFMFAMALFMASLQINAQIDDCQSSCLNAGTIKTFTATIKWPNFGVDPTDYITYTFTYNQCPSGVMYMVNMNWKARYKGQNTAYNVNGYDRVNDILSQIWANFPSVHTVGFPASCFKMEYLSQSNVYYEGIITRTDYTSLIYCDKGCCLFKRGEYAGDAIEIQDQSSVNTCNQGCFPFCRGNRP